MRPYPLEPGMTSLPNTGVVRIFLPHSLPVDVHIDVVAVDHDPFDLELKRDGLKGVEVGVRLPLQSFEVIERQHHRLKTRTVLLLVRLTQRFHGLVDTAEPFVVFGILDRLRGAGGEAERQDDGAPEQPVPGEARPHTFATHRAAV